MSDQAEHPADDVRASASSFQKMTDPYKATQEPAPSSELGWLKVVEELVEELRLHCKDPIHDQQLLDVRAYRLLIDGAES